MCHTLHTPHCFDVISRCHPHGHDTHTPSRAGHTHTHQGQNRRSRNLCRARAQRRTEPQQVSSNNRHAIHTPSWGDLLRGSRRAGRPQGHSARARRGKGGRSRKQRPHTTSTTPIDRAVRTCTASGVKTGGGYPQPTRHQYAIGGVREGVKVDGAANHPPLPPRHPYTSDWLKLGCL
jgi:hypothetical protein